MAKLTSLTLPLLFTIIFSTAKVSSFTNNALVVPISKDTNTSLYTIPLTSTNASFVVDISRTLLWSQCPSSHPTIPCDSSICSAANSFIPPSCSNYTNTTGMHSCNCTAYVDNPVSGVCASGDLTQTDLTLYSTDGHHPTGIVTAYSLYSSCAPASLLQSLPPTSSGVVGLAPTSLAIATQLASALNFKNQFALCLPSVAFFGEGPFYLLPPPGRNISSLLSYTTLLSSEKNPGYYLNVSYVAVAGKIVQYPETSYNKSGAVKISTTVPFTVLRDDVYKPFLESFTNASAGLQTVPSVKPFDLCFNSSGLISTRLGYAVPQIDIVLGTGQNWTIFGANSVVQVSADTACFAFYNGGVDLPVAAILGGFQLEDNFVVFDVVNSRIGFSGLLFGIQTTCGNFNFTLGAN